MNPSVRNLFDLKRLHAYKRPAPLILVNGLAEQSESWFANRTHWSRHFDVKVPEILVYDGDSLHRQIDAGGEVTVDYLADRLADYLDEFVQRPPYHLVGSSLGGQVILTYAVRHPEKVSQAGPDLPLGPPRRREPADDRRRPAEPLRHRWSSRSSTATHFATDELVDGDRAEVPGPEVEEGGPPDAPGDRRPLGGPAPGAGRRTRPW